MIYAVARSAATNRPVCQHALVLVRNGQIIASCGYDLTGASITYLEQPLEAIMCMTCKKVLNR